MTLLINQLDQHNEGNILATIKYDAEEVIFIRQKENEGLMENIKNYYRENLSKVKLNDLIIEEGEIEKLEKLIINNNNNNTIVNLTGGKRINSLILLELCKENGLKSLYIDIKKKTIYNFINGIKVSDESFEDLDISDIINAAGGQIIEDSSNLCKKKDLIYFSEQIYKHLDLWHKYKLKLYDSNIFVHDNVTPSRISINKDRLQIEEIDLLTKILNKLREMNEISFNESQGQIQVNFLNRYLKGFIFKSGTWLEIATNTLINKIKEVDEAKNGVVFLWNNENKIVRNEVDVVAVKDSVPICISCKDSEKYNEMALNELNVYANKLGGNNVYKILVATKEPIKAPVKIRAKEMGISLVIFDGNENNFINEIKQIIRK